MCDKGALIFKFCSEWVSLARVRPCSCIQAVFKLLPAAPTNKQDEHIQRSSPNSLYNMFLVLCSQAVARYHTDFSIPPETRGAVWWTRLCFLKPCEGGSAESDGSAAVWRDAAAAYSCAAPWSFKLQGLFWQTHMWARSDSCFLSLWWKHIPTWSFLSCLRPTGQSRGGEQGD